MTNKSSRFSVGFQGISRLVSPVDWSYFKNWFNKNC